MKAEVDRRIRNQEILEALGKIGKELDIRWVREGDPLKTALQKILTDLVQSTRREAIEECAELISRCKGLIGSTNSERLATELRKLKEQTL